MDYGQSVVTIRVLEKRLLTKNRLERMIESETCEEVLKLLSETEYSQDMTDIQNSRDYEKILKRETERVFSLVRNMSKNKEVVDILSLKYDYHNLKVLIKSKVFEKDNTNLLMNAGTIDITKFKTKSETQSLDLPEEILEAIAEIKKEEKVEKVKQEKKLEEDIVETPKEVPKETTIEKKPEVPKEEKAPVVNDKKEAKTEAKTEEKKCRIV